jgi:hypothetical protein
MDVFLRHPHPLPPLRREGVHNGSRSPLHAKRGGDEAPSQGALGVGIKRKSYPKLRLNSILFIILPNCTLPEVVLALQPQLAKNANKTQKNLTKRNNRFTIHCNKLYQITQ